MALADSMDQLKAEIADFTSKISGDFQNTINYPALVGDAESMEGYVASEIMDELLDRAKKHIASKGVNVHGTTPESLGTYNKNTFDIKLDALLDKDGDSPLSFYGDREYLPPTVTGSFESGVNWAPYGGVGLFLEDNGTLMMLRTGSDGVTAGVYYGYLRNALNTSLITEIVMTNARYKPAYFPVDQQAAAVLFANQDLIIGMMVNKTTMQPSGYFVSLTNDTYDMTKHTGIIIPMGDIINTVPTDRIVLGLPIGYVKGNQVFILTNLDVEDRKIGGWKVWSIPKNDLITGVYNGATAITGWTINRGVKGLVTRTHLQYCDDGLAHVTYTDGRCFSADGRQAGNRPHMVRRNPKNDKIEMVGFTTAWPSINTNIFQYLVTGQQWVFEIFDNRSIDVSKYYNDPPVFGVNAAQTGWQVVRGIQAQAPKQLYGNFIPSHNTTRMMLTENNYVFMYNTYDLYTQRYLTRYKYDDAETFSRIMGQEVEPTLGISDLYEGRYASPVTFLFGSVTNYGDHVLSAINKGWNKKNKVEFMPFRAATQGGVDYQYGSLTGLALKGFIPTGDRKWLEDLPSNVKFIKNTVNETDASGWQVSSARWDTTYWLNRPGWNSIDVNLNGVGQVTCANGVMDSLKTQVKTHFANLGLPTLTAFGGESTWCELIVPQRYGDMPAFVHGHHLASNRIAYYFIARVNLAGSRQGVVGATLDTGSLIYRSSPHGYQTCFYTGAGATDGCAGQIAIRRVEGGFALGLITVDRFSYYGNSIATCNLVTYNGAFSFVGAIDYDQQQISILNWLNYPSHGLMLSASSENHRWPLDCGTKLIGVVACKDQMPVDSPATLMSRFMNPAYATIMLSQQTVTAWTVYFADPTPAMVNGKYYDMPIYTHTLDPATAANKTFHCWVVKRTDSEFLDYYIAAQTGIPFGVEGALYIGYFTTDNNGLNKVDVSKRIAVADMLLSADSRGQAIPLTSGVPATYGRFNWR